MIRRGLNDVNGVVRTDQIPQRDEARDTDPDAARTRRTSTLQHDWLIVARHRSDIAHLAIAAPVALKFEQVIIETKTDLNIPNGKHGIVFSISCS